MNGQMSICQICAYQDRRVDDGQNARCVLPHPTIDYDTCDAFDVLEGRPLGARLAELYNLLDLAWDVIMALLDEVEGRRGVRFPDADRNVFADLSVPAGPEEGSSYVGRAASGIDALK